MLNPYLLKNNSPVVGSVITLSLLHYFMVIIKVMYYLLPFLRSHSAIYTWNLGLQFHFIFFSVWFHLFSSLFHFLLDFFFCLTINSQQKVMYPITNNIFSQRRSCGGSS